MYNKYFSSDPDAFSEMYRDVEYEHKPEPQKSAEPPHEKGKFDLSRMLRGLDVNKMGIVPLMLLLILLLDADEEERIIVIALVMILGI